MRRAMVAVAATILVADGATAQMTPQVRQGASPSTIVKNREVRKSAMTASGGNSFTILQARTRMEKAGYTGIGALTKDQNGFLQAMAKNGAKRVCLSLNYSGRVTAR